MKLSRMQDIGGCRAVVNTVAEVQDLFAYHIFSKMKHRLVHDKDYIQTPKPSGYRGLHLIYRYRSDKNDTYNGLLIEVQLRSRLQHAWATAVETAGAFLGQALKSSQGEADWLRFFALASSVFALREGYPAVPDTPSQESDLNTRLREYGARLRVVERMHDYRALITTIPEFGKEVGGQYFLLERRPDKRETQIAVFSRRDFHLATEAYTASETRVADVNGADAVLVSVDSIKALTRAYPNYWLDTGVFLDELLATLRDPSLS